jgi:hypothetical protein
MIKKTNLVGVVALGLCVVMPLACGSSGGSVGDDFCAKYANATCAKTIGCPDANFPLPANFTMANCVQGFTHLCTDKPSAAATPATNCYGATQVNSAAETMCLAAVMATTCDQVNNKNGMMATYDDVCSTVCGAPATTGGAGAGGTTGSGTAGTGAAGTTGAGGSAPAPADASAFCHQLLSVDCDQAYKCVAPADRTPDFVAAEGSSIEECKGPLLTMNCATALTDCPSYNSLFAQACVNKYAVESCDDIAAVGPPAECQFVCPP